MDFHFRGNDKKNKSNHRELKEHRDFKNLFTLCAQCLITRP